MKSALVTGAAQRPWRRHRAAGLHRKAIASRSSTPTRGRAAQASKLPEAVAFAADVTDEAAIEAVLDAFGDVPDVLVNNAGIVRFGPLLSTASRNFAR